MESISAFEIEPGSETAEEALRTYCGDNCHPSLEQQHKLQRSDLVMISGQFVGAGKSRVINKMHEAGRYNIPSYVNRDLRPGEQEGIDKYGRDTDEMLTMIQQGKFLEMEEVRPGRFYATSLVDTDSEYAYVKDAELQGALRLREKFDPGLPIVVPLPPFTLDRTTGVTEWERRAVGRDFFGAQNFDSYHADLYARLHGAAVECDRIVESELIDDSNTLVFVNEDINRSWSAVQRFLNSREKPNSSGLRQYVGVLRGIAVNALEAYNELR